MQLTDINNYDYDLPKELIAKYPLANQEYSKLLVYNKHTKKIIHSTFKDLIKFIPPNAKIFFNDTKVIKARIFGKKETGGKIELLLNKPITQYQFNVLIKGKVKLNQKLIFQNLQAIVIDLLADGSRIVEFYKNNIKLSFDDLIQVLNQIGHIPLPPYIQRQDTKTDEQTYQTIFAKKYGAVAAPTASLHITSNLLHQLKTNFDVNFLTLHVGAGTFKPVEVDNILQHKMHSEYYEIDKQVANIIDNNQEILAVGTTVTRTIEYYHQTKLLKGEANIFINPINKPKKVKYLITNFHLPKSTLIMLVAGFIGIDETKRIYQEAIRHKYRFFSYGDGMMII
jgi:S-adenosylmethionine:tRNA ribosyltransferase-isomerase